MYPDRARMDFAMEDLSKERITSIEEKFHEAVEADYSIRAYTLPREKAALKLRRLRIKAR